MTGSPRIAVLQPDFGGAGGFERHVGSVAATLRARGWTIEQLRLDATKPKPRLFGLPIDPVQHEFHDDFFKYLALVAQVAALDLTRYDAVLTTQPPTYLAPHPRKLALFYHQARQFYDLADVYVESGFAEADIHRSAAEAVWAIDGAGVGSVGHWLAGSATVAGRLQRYWNVPMERITPYHAPAECAVSDQPLPYRADGPIVHVGRMEWPKRVELLVHAVHHLESPRTACLVGTGSRAGYVRSLDARLRASGPADLEGAGQDQVWETSMTRGIFAAGWSPFQGEPSGRLKFIGSLSDGRRDELYAGASMVVAPAFNEDYGLTAVEAMSFARPVIVCQDGGGLTELVEHEVTGLVVPPTPGDMAKAIERLLSDPDLAASLGRAGFERVSDLSHASAASVIEDGLERVLGS